jgi:putative FmdB family regulatory protein
MPTYDYRCNNCDHEFEEFQSMSAKTLRKCPECGKLKLERLIGTGAAVIFKGSGFYETDYRSESYKKSAEADKKSSSDSKSDSKDSKKDKASTPCGCGKKSQAACDSSKPAKPDKKKD